jgi:hypothetical protein
MRNFTIFVVVNVFGAIGWWLGSYFGMGAALALSAVGSLTGVYVGWRLYQAYLS